VFEGGIEVVVGLFGGFVEGDVAVQDVVEFLVERVAGGFAGGVVGGCMWCKSVDKCCYIRQKKTEKN